jgi:Spy/CpxP family protein refolding chaperone
MRVKQMVTLGMLATVVFLVPLTGTAGNGGFNPPWAGHGPGPLALLMELDLSDTQQDDIAAIFSKYNREMEEKNEALMTAMEQVNEVTHGDTFVEANIRQACQQASSLHEELAVLRAKIRAEIMAVLDSEQIERFLALEAERMRHHERPI